MKKSFYFAFISCIILLNGCGTFQNMYPRPVRIVSSPSDANFTIYGRADNPITQVDSFASEIQSDLTTPDMVVWLPNKYSYVKFEKNGYTSKTVKLEKTRPNPSAWIGLLYIGFGALYVGLGNAEIRSEKENNYSSYDSSLGEATRSMGYTFMSVGGVMALIDIVTGNFYTYPRNLSAKLEQRLQTNIPDNSHSNSFIDQQEINNYKSSPQQSPLDNDNKIAEEMNIRDNGDSDNFIMQQAREQANNLRVETKKNTDKIRSEANSKAQEMVQAAKNPISKKAAEVAAQKVRDVAEEQIKKIEEEVEKQIETLLKTAQEKM